MSATVIPSEADVLLGRAEAREILERHARVVKNVVRCCDDGAVLFIGALGRPWTAWIRRDPDGITVQYEQGWSAQLGSSSRVSTVEKVPEPTTEEECDQA